MFSQSLHAILRSAIETKVANCLVAGTTDRESEVITRKPAQRAPKQHARETVTAEKVVVGQHAREQQRDVALDHSEEEHGVEAVQLDQVRQKLEAVHISASSKRCAVSSRIKNRAGCAAFPTAYCSLLTLPAPLPVVEALQPELGNWRDAPPPLRLNQK